MRREERLIEYPISQCVWFPTLRHLILLDRNVEAFNGVHHQTIRVIGATRSVDFTHIDHFADEIFHESANAWHEIEPVSLTPKAYRSWKFYNAEEKIALTIASDYGNEDSHNLSLDYFRERRDKL